MPIRARIALFGASVVTATILFFSLLLYALAANGISSNQAAELARRGNATAAMLQAAPPAAVGAARFLLPVDLSTSSDTFVALIDASGQPVLSTGSIGGEAPTVPASVLRVAATQGWTMAVAPGSVPLRIFVRVRLAGHPAAGYIVAGQATRVVESQLRGLRSFLFVAGAISFLGALAANWWIAGRALRPLRLVARTAEDIGRTQDLHRRLATGRRKDEIGLLTASFNQMLERLESAYARLAGALETQRRFLADASHELRTPLTTIRTNAGLLQQRPDVGVADRQEALNDIVDESERMSRLVEHLLMLARADAGQHLPLARLDWRSLIWDVCRQAQRAQPDRRIRIDAPVPVVVSGNADALKQLLWILLDNALRHAPAGENIAVILETTDGYACLSVTDDGPGIAPADLTRIFDRFYRSDRARAGGGAGLGLSIASWIVQEHRGLVRAANVQPHGAALYVTVPLLLGHS